MDSYIAVIFGQNPYEPVHRSNLRIVFQFQLTTFDPVLFNNAYNIPVVHYIRENVLN